MPRLWCVSGRIAALAVLAIAASSCSGSTTAGADAGSVAPDAAYAGVPTGSSRDGQSLTERTDRPLDPLAPSRIARVVRPGPAPDHRLRARQVGFAHPVSYPDGVRISVVDIRQTTVTGRGPGILSGPMTSLRLRLVNGSRTTLDLDHVVVTTVYGQPARIARPVYVDGTQDLAGRVRPGGRATATYAFSVPTSELAHVAVHIDFDSRHAVGVFSGSTDSQN